MVLYRMEAFIIRSRFQHYAQQANLSRQLPTTSVVPQDLGEVLSLNQQLNSTVTPTNRMSTKSTDTMNTTGYDVYTEDMLADNSSFLWNNTVLFNLTNSTDYNFDYESQTQNGSVYASGTWSYCIEWSAAQHTLFQTANLFFAAAFLVPMSFKQSVLLVR